MTRSYLAALGLLTLGLAAFTHPAQARVFVGIGVPLPYFGPPAYYPPPPAYYPPPPPYYYAPPPPVMYASPPPPEYGGSCNAGSYACPLDRPMPPGSACDCIGNGGQRVRGNAN